MSLDIGFDAQAPSLPRGGGAIGGLGETFAPDLSTGTGSYAVRLDCPNGPNDIGPKLALRYDTAAGNGHFGMGFSLPFPRLIRSTARGYPRYDASDSLMLEGAGELLALGSGKYRPQVDGGAWQAQAEGDGFRLTDRDGLQFVLGATAAGRLFDVAAPTRVFGWHLERIADALGNVAQFTWLRDGNQLYVASVAYGAYEVRFTYRTRPDPVRFGRAGFPITTNLICQAIELHLVGAAQPLLRRWTLTHTAAEGNACSLLTGVTLSGFDAAGGQLDAPRLSLTYSQFKPRELRRFSSQDEGARPGPLDRVGRRTEVIDWNGNGLPDLLEISEGGRARVWPNRGECVWGRPQPAGTVPLFAGADAAVAIADMDGDGMADLVRADVPLRGYIPRDVDGGFARPVAWSQAPAVLPSANNVRMVDLNGDGITDLLTSSASFLTLYYRSSTDGWQERPQALPRPSAPDINLDDPHVFVADMTGDGSADIVRVNGAGVTYWPYLGLGRWDAPVVMSDPPQLPAGVQPERLFLSDVDGDGCADLIYLDQGRLIYWINRAGSGFSEPRVMDFVPTGQARQMRLADMDGSGTAGVLWSTPNTYFYLDFTGAAKPYLLESTDNGLGLTTHIEYSTSAHEAARDARDGEPWSTRLPVVIPVVSALRLLESSTGRSSSTRYRYHDGRFDGVLREFAGFARVEEDQIGDEIAPTLRTLSWFHTGVNPDEPREPKTREERMRLRGIRGRLYRQEHYGLDGTAQEKLPYDRLLQDWNVAVEATAAGSVCIPRLLKITRATIERAAAPISTITTSNLAFDPLGNIIESVEVSELVGEPSAKLTLRTVSSFVKDPKGRFVSRAARVQQFDGAGLRIADTITRYDNQPEGQVGERGLVTQRSALVLTDALVSDIYGAETPDFAAMGYHRRAGEDGWWIDPSTYQRVDDAAGLRGTVTSALGAQTKIEFEPTRMFIARIEDPHGNTTVARHDLRVCRLTGLTDADRSVHEARYDALGRIAAVVHPGDTSALPSVQYVYDTASTPASLETRGRAVSGAPETIDGREFYDGFGALLESRVRDETGEISLLSHRYCARGLIASTATEERATSPSYAPPAPGRTHASFTYDALGRRTRLTHPDGSVRTWAYGPLFIVEADEEDTRTDAAATHAGSVTRTRLDATGRVRAVEQMLSGRTLASRYEYDLKGNLTRHTDALGHERRLRYDLLGRTLRVDKPENATLTVLDALANPVQSRPPSGTRVFREFDACNRPVVVRYGSPTSAPVASFTYHDAGLPAPPDAGAHTLGGRCVRIEDESGVNVFDYDAHGRRTHKRSTPLGSATTFDLDLSFRADGQLTEIRYPNDGAGRLAVRYEYDKRGLVKRVPGVAPAIDYDLAGRRTAVHYANGTEQKVSFELLTGRCSALQLSGPSGVLRSTQYVWDRVGNLLRIDSSDPKLATSYEYDDLYRLTAARTASGQSWSYRYDDVGNITHRSDVGDYHYGELGAPATCLTSAGTDSYTYTPDGAMHETPWGTQSFDAMGRLVKIARVAAGTSSTFRYDCMGRRVAATNAGGTRLTPDELYAIEDGVLVLHLMDGQGLAARRRGSSTVFLHPDHLGTLVLVTDAAGAPQDSIRYDPYGLVLDRTGASKPLPIGFGGGVPETDPGLVYFNARYYQPRIGRFVSPDAIVQDPYDPIAWNAYAFCGNNPASHIDPSGRNFWGILFACIAIAALVVVTILTFGTAAPATLTAAIAVISIGFVAGGVVGGIAAAKQHGDLEAVITGALVGAAVGGWAAFATVVGGGAGAAFAKSIGLAGNAIVAGGINGAIGGAAMGFATGMGAGFGSGKFSAEYVFWKMAQGALIGAATGMLLGWLTSYKPESPAEPGSQSSLSPMERAQQPDPMHRGMDENPLRDPFAADPSAHTLSDAAGKVQGALQSKALEAGKPLALAAAAKIAPFATVQVLLVDVGAGGWDLFGYRVVDRIKYGDWRDRGDPR